VSVCAERGDQQDRTTRPGFWSAAYWPMLGGTAPVCGPGDHSSARAFLLRLEAAIDRGGWTRNEWRNLHKLYYVWSRRANGEDPRFEHVGVRAGRLDRTLEAHIRQRRKVFEMADWVRVAQPLRTVDAADPTVRPADSTLRARVYRRRRRLPRESQGL
jgi:hypothetical protein